jgi:FtsP/CotA-like multicopper oxidase with cupredoxin domain
MHRKDRPAASRSTRRGVLVAIPALSLALALVALMIGGMASAGPSSPTDETKVPHYFGPYPNWANSPLASPDAVVTITGDGNGAKAVATVGANGAITAIDVTDGGSGYGTAKVTITGSGTGASADAVIIRKGAVADIAVTNGGAGYTAPTVAITGNGSGATATAYGGVDAVTLTDVGLGYTVPNVTFDLPDASNGVPAEGKVTCQETNCQPANLGDPVHITGVVVTQPGSGYSSAPGVSIINGTQFDPVQLADGGHEAVAKATLTISSIVVETPGTGYSRADVAINDPNGTGATATATLQDGVISAITLKKPGSGYVSGGLKKFVDTLPGIPAADPAKNNNAADKGDTSTWKAPAADYYWIGLIQFKQKMHRDLPDTTIRGYVQLTRSPTSFPIVAPNRTTDPVSGDQLYAVAKPTYLGPTIVATKDKPVRIKFSNLLPTGSDGDLFLPVDTTLMGSGEGAMGDTDSTPVPGGTVMDAARNPLCGEKYYDPALRKECFTENRATIHLHGGNTPWISDGTAHQWLTPAGEDTKWQKGVSAQNVPDMADPGPGSQTFYYSNQQSARLLFYHDHAWGITRLNVYAGEAAGYLITDPTEQKLLGANGPLNGLGVGTPLVIQDKTFVPDAAQLAKQDPTWDPRWGTKGSFWYHHVYMPAQNPGDPSGMSAFGRWMYGPWFWPPAGDAKHGPIDNPYFKPDCKLDDPSTWQYQTDPFCEPEKIPGTPNVSVGMEQFNDTPVVNGVAYPTVTLQPKAYRFRMLSAANDRFFNLQWYVADSTGTEVALKAAEVAAAQTDPNVFPTPDTAKSPVGPNWIQIGTEGGFLPAPVVVPNQPTTWITDPTRFDVGNVDKHSLLLAPAERADVVVDFSQFAGKTLILYNDAPAAFPARVPQYDYYTGGPDLSPAGAPTTLPGYGPNTRTIMQVKIGSGSNKAFNLTALKTAFAHKADGSGVFESGQHPIIVGQAAYNSAYGTSFAASGNCSTPTSTIKCDGLARINQQGGDPFTFDTLRMKADGTYPAGFSKVSIPLKPKAIHDEMNSSAFDEYGRMQANLGVEAVPATPGLQNVILHPFTYPGTELIDASLLPKGDVKVTPIAKGDDGSQIWKITHNGVDTHPIHFHAYDVQVINRVTWDNIIIQPDATELGWKDTVRISPLEDTIVALRPVLPTPPFDIPNSVRLLSPFQTEGAWMANTTAALANGSPMLAFAPNGEPIDIKNHYVNFGEEYTYHCHILSHEEMDMMRPVSIALPPLKPDGLAVDLGTNTITWKDNSLSETQFVVQKLVGTEWQPLGKVDRLLFDPVTGSPVANTAGDTLSFTDAAIVAGTQYRVVAENTVGDTWDYSNPGLNQIAPGSFAFPVVTTKSISAPVTA